MEVAKVIDGHPYSTQSSEYISASPSPRRVNDMHEGTSGYIVVSTHSKQLVGPYWAELCASEEAELRRALRSDVAALCGLPLQAVRHVTCEVLHSSNSNDNDDGGVELRFEVEHDTRRLTTEEVRGCVEQGSCVELETLYATHHLIHILPPPSLLHTQAERQRQQQDDDDDDEMRKGVHQRSNGSETDSPLPRHRCIDHTAHHTSLTRGKQSKHAEAVVQHAGHIGPQASMAHVEQWLNGDCGLDSLATQKEELAEQLALAQASSKVEELEELAEQIAFREAMMSAMALQRQQRARSRECAAMIERCSVRTGGNENEETRQNSVAGSMNEERGSSTAPMTAIQPHTSSFDERTPALSPSQPHTPAAATAAAVANGTIQQHDVHNSPPPVPPFVLPATDQPPADAYYTYSEKKEAEGEEGGRRHAALLERLTQLEQRCHEYQHTIEALKSERCELEAREARTQEELQMVLEVLQEKKATIAALTAEQQAQPQPSNTQEDDTDDQYIVVSTHSKQLVGPYWAELCASEEAELRRALRSDVAALCGLPLQAVRHVTCEVLHSNTSNDNDDGGVELRFEVEHDTRRLTTEEVNGCVEQGSCVELDRLYTQHAHYAAQLARQQKSYAAAEAALRAEVEQLTRLLQHSLTSPSSSSLLPSAGKAYSMTRYHLLCPSQSCANVVAGLCTKTRGLWQAGVLAVMLFADSLESRWASLRRCLFYLWQAHDEYSELHWALQAELRAVQQAVAYCEAQYTHFERDTPYWTGVRRDLDAAVGQVRSDVRTLTRCAQGTKEEEEEQHQQHDGEERHSHTGNVQQQHYESSKQHLIAYLTQHLAQTTRALWSAQAETDEVRRQLTRHQARLQRAERVTAARRRRTVPAIDTNKNSSNASMLSLSAASALQASNNKSKSKGMNAAAADTSRQDRSASAARRRALFIRVAALKATWRAASAGLVQLYEGRAAGLAQQLEWVRKLSHNTPCDHTENNNNNNNNRAMVTMSRRPGMSAEEWALLREVCAASHSAASCTDSCIVSEGTWLSVCLGGLLCMALTTLRCRRRERG